MPGLLSRSKSMRLLKSHRRDAQQDTVQKLMPPSAGSQTDIDRNQSATPVSRKERRLETPDIAPRPSTSGGPGDRRTAFHMKTYPVASIHSQNNLPSSVPLNSTTAHSTTGAFDSSEGIIGIALGSPTVGSHWTGTPQASTTDVASQNTDIMSAWSPISPPSARTEAPKSKLSRWKSMFRKAAPPPPQPEKQAFYQLTTTITATRAGRADSHHDEEQVKPVIEPVSDRDTGRTPSPPTFKPNIRASRAFTTPRSAPAPPQTRPRAVTANSLPANPRVSVVRSATTPAPSSAVRNGHPTVPQSKPSNNHQNGPPVSESDMPMLDVSIPDIKLDRYSVMFGNLLQSTTSNRSSSLLVRRQGNTDKLKPLNKLSVKDHEQESPIDYKLQRRATSPVMPSPSPRLSLFPSTRNSPVPSPSPRSASVPRSKKLHRSKTSPEKSPLRQTFSQKEMDSQKAKDLFVQHDKHTASPPVLESYVSSNLKVQHLAITPNSIRSFESDNDSITLVVGRTSPGQPLHLDDREPEWEIMTKPPAPKRANTAPITDLQRTPSQRTQPTVTKLSALSSHPSSAPLEAPSPLQKIQQLQSPPQSARQEPSATPKAMVGVARSVSVSRANSPRTLVRTASVVRSPGAKGEFVGSGQALTPTMVEVRNRKSQRVQLVDA
ncbi:hypothetical protein HBH64_072490 [Parastagonospora nodorum]|nr:hypothetical protein HBH51_133360 [Parastagonospora nodorum]KAH4027604.1 hypothetical protein HBI09_140890 [Parastagonospora nodorum]KAH4121364.1 hypothetical protein HBH47_102370 [Parastagonospora nodorum]KAH4240213.1 hypothetical protein HBI06_028530 [Parastagonospora nodorum]KAH4244599.1 hypothetical protein HBI05_072980 [Parastagonospora nodorum]